MFSFTDYLGNLSEKIQSVESSQLELAVRWIQGATTRKGKIIVAGNGGSAAMASHVTVDLTKNAKTRAINFNEADLITCFANDYGYEHWIGKALEFYADPQDLVILISSSGKSKNIINAAQTARQLKMPLITFSGFDADNPLRKLGDLNFWVKSNAYNQVEMTHHIWLLAIVDRIIGDPVYSAS